MATSSLHQQEANQIKNLKSIYKNTIKKLINFLG
jgi:hypothetical protein